MRFTSLNKSILATGWLVIALAMLITTKFNPAMSYSVTNNTNFVDTNVITKQSKNKTASISKTDLECMVLNIYYEAGGESLLGKLAVGQVVLNRLAKSNNTTTVCGIVNAKSKDAAVCAFSWVCDSTLSSANTTSSAWRESTKAALTVFENQNTPERDFTDGATHYHNLTVNPPWSQTLTKVTRIDNHVFYK